MDDLSAETKLDESGASDRISEKYDISDKTRSDSSVPRVDSEGSSSQDTRDYIEKTQLEIQCKSREVTTVTSHTEVKSDKSGESEVNVTSAKSDESEKSANISEKSSDKSADVSGNCDELMYEKDKKRLCQTSVEHVQSKRIKLDEEEFDIMDEEALERIPSHKLYEKLKSVDPHMADQLHPNNKRKIIR